MPKRGFYTFPDQETAIAFLEALPYPYVGCCYKTEGGKWAVSFRVGP
jgi:hypothetical protein